MNHEDLLESIHLPVPASNTATNLTRDKNGGDHFGLRDGLLPGEGHREASTLKAGACNLPKLYVVVNGNFQDTLMLCGREGTKLTLSVPFSEEPERL